MVQNVLEAKPWFIKSLAFTFMCAQASIPESVTLSDLSDNWSPKRELDTNPEGTPDEVEVLKRLPRGKAPGPDEIPNEILQLLLLEWKVKLAHTITKVLQLGQIPPSFKESTTIALRKERRPDYSLPSSYRPIALENSMAKLIERIVADRLTVIEEEHSMLPWAQMGTRKDRSTTSALELLTSTVQTAWDASPGCVVSTLGLDIKGAFDNVSTERLLWVLRREGIPEWMVKFIHSFVTQRRTKIKFTGYTIEWISTVVGIPQGSHLSPILFLFYMAERLESVQRPDNGYIAFGFVDDTILVAWGENAHDNCRTLEQAHDRCLAWARRYGAEFAPEKYQLIHFSRKTKRSTDLSNGIQVEGIDVSPITEMKVLGVLVDSRLRWGAQVAQAANKGEAAYNALSRITSSVWGPSLHQARLVYSSVVRLKMLYGSQIWGNRCDGQPMAKSLMGKLERVQNKCLRKVTGGYKRTPKLTLEREAAILPIDLHIKVAALRYGASTKEKPVTREIRLHVDSL
ncbi:hypothetical protein K3495_g14462 [Podosphaera aphanis]|nr:hypothetical protein K3495_g14462 [Podosphaera aphanis]